MTTAHRLRHLEHTMDRCLALANGRITALELELLALAAELDRTTTRALELEARLEGLESSAVQVHRPRP